MYNQRESLAYITITPALQAGGPRFEPASAHQQTVENTSCVSRQNPRPPRAGDHSACQYPGNLPEKCQDAATMFRLESVTYGGAEDDSFYTSRRELYFLEVPVVKATPKGHWIDYYGSRKFILSAARKKWAYPTKEEALESFIARKKRQIKILKAQVEEAAVFLGMAASKQGQEGDLNCQRTAAYKCQGAGGAE